jgi:hypothetical protein
MGSDENQVTLLDKNGVHPLPKASKKVLSIEILTHISHMLTP